MACFAGTFGGFWIGYGLLVLALIHGWFAIPPEDIQRTVAVFAIAFASFFLFLALASLRLPIIYFLIFILVVAALCFVAAAYLMTPVNTDLLKVAGYIVFVFAGLGMLLSWTVMNLSLGGPAFPPLGPRSSSRGRRRLRRRSIAPTRAGRSRPGVERRLGYRYSRRKRSNRRRWPSSSRRISITMSCVAQVDPSQTSMIRR